MYATTAPIAKNVLSDELRRRATRHAAPISWRRALGYALLCGVANTVLESLVMPTGELGWREMLAFMLALLPGYWITCVAVTCLAMIVEPRMTVTMVAVTTMAAALAGAAAGVGFELVRGQLFFNIDAYLFGRPRPLLTKFASNAWAYLFYGGLLMMVLVLVMRAERTRGLLGNAEIARSQTETVLSQAQLQALRGQVDPDLLLRVMAEVQRRYAQDPAAAEGLLDQLVGFLRGAMPGVRSGRSTLAAELALVQSYVQLRAELDPQRARWQICINAPLPELPFPPLLLLPVLDRLSGRGLSVRRETQRIRLSIDGPVEAGWLPAELAYRLRVGLRAQYGEAWTLDLSEAGASGAPALMLELPIEALAPAPPAAGTHDSTIGLPGLVRSP